MEFLVGSLMRLALDILIGVSGRVALQSLADPCARTLGPLARWTKCKDEEEKDEEGKNIPELSLNLTLLVEMFLRLFASGLGTLALVWATVVLLGGFSTMLIRLDFWFITAIVFIQTTRIVGYNSGPEAKFFVDVPTGFTLSKKFLGHLISVSNWIAQAPIVAAIGCSTLSIIRIVGIARLGSGGIYASNSILKPAIILFYALVLIQGAVFFLWLFVAVKRLVFSRELLGYFKNTEVLKSDVVLNLMDRYITATHDSCIEKGVVSTLNRTLVSFAAELLQSEYDGDHVSGVSVLYLVITRKERREGVVNQICASEKLVGRLFQFIRSKSFLDQDARAYATEILVKIAGKLHPADIPEADHWISSLFDGLLMETASQTEFPGEDQIVNDDTDSRRKGKPLFLGGLMILGELAADIQNQTQICHAMDLVPKILAPVSHGLLKLIGTDSKTIQIVKASLVLVAKLTSGKGETGAQLRSTISKDKRIIENLFWILQKSDGMKSNGDHEMEILSLEILTRLSLDNDETAGFIGLLGDLFSHVHDSPLKMPVLRALNALAAEHGTCQLIIWKEGRWGPLIQQLIDMVRMDANYEYRAAVAELLAQILANSKPGQGRDRLKPLSGLLSMVLQAIVVETADCTHFVKKLEHTNAEITSHAKRLKDLQLEATRPPTPVIKFAVDWILDSKWRQGFWSFCKDDQYELFYLKEIIYRRMMKDCDKHIKDLQKNRHKTRLHAKGSRRFIYAFLSLVGEICDKLGITDEDLTNALTKLQMNDSAFARKLVEIVCLASQPLDDYDADLARLKIVKTMTKLVRWMMRTNQAYIKFFRQENIIEKLHRAMQVMRDLERDLVLAGCNTDHENEDYESLQSLVENVRVLFWS